ncbi:apolipoprotein D-like [Menidia menidia]
MLLAALLLLTLPLSAPQLVRWGACPSPRVQPNFDLHKYLGRWYEIQKIPNTFARGKCIQAQYALRKDGTIRVLNCQVLKDKTRCGEGTAVIKDMREKAKLGVSFSFFTPYSPYWVLSTDYGSVSIVYSCTDVLHLFRYEYAFILSRSRFLDPRTLHHARGLLDTEGLDTSRLQATDQTGCKDL